MNLVDQTGYGTSQAQLVVFIKFDFSPKFACVEEIRSLYTEKGLSAGQIATRLRVAKSYVLARLHGLGIRDEGKIKRYTTVENYRCPKPPFGYKVINGRLVLNKNEVYTCRVIVDLVENKGGHLSGSSKRAKPKKTQKQGRKDGLEPWECRCILQKMEI